MPPTSSKQARYVFEMAHQGKPWAAKFIKDAPTMQVVKKGSPLPAIKHQYDSEKTAIVKAALKKHRKHG